MDLFSNRDASLQKKKAPLADRMRPEKLRDLVGQDHLTGRDSLLRQAIEHDTMFSIILWGPPGCGKTTLAGIIANATSSEFVRISAVLSGVREVRQIIEKATEQRRLHNRQTILFVDEIHRFNKAQQDAFLHHVETGLITLIGATTQNPSFEVIPALVSRCRVFSLFPLNSKQISRILVRAVEDEIKGLGQSDKWISHEALMFLADHCDGDARAALTNLEIAAQHLKDKTSVEKEDVAAVFQKKSLLYDRSGEEHFNLISAFIKSMRGSDPDAAMYWMERMLTAGEDPYYLLRRMIRFATEDIGMADPGALTMALNADRAYRVLGPPEGGDVLFQCAVYLSTAPKSNAVYAGHKRLKKIISETGYQPVPLHIRNAPTKMMKQMGYAQGYKYPHDHKGGVVQQDYLPEGLEDKIFYSPTDRGYEKTVKQRLDAIRKLKSKEKKRSK